MFLTRVIDTVLKLLAVYINLLISSTVDATMILTIFY